MVLLQTLHGAVSHISRGLADRQPFLRGHVHLLDDIFPDGDSAVVLRSPPVELAGVLGGAVDLQGSEGHPRSAEEDHLDKLCILAVFVGSGDLVLLRVLALALLNGELGVERRVLNLNVVTRLDFLVEEGPHGFRLRLAL